MEPAVKPAVENHKDKRILVTRRRGLKGEKLKKLITRLTARITSICFPCPACRLLRT
jgi:hypothetical protein